MPPVTWLSLAIGNSRLHWAEFADDRLQKTWHTAHLSTAEVRQHIQALEARSSPPELWIASVVPAQDHLWLSYSRARSIRLEHIPLSGVYATLGLDRALALWGAITTIGAPVLVVDAGTALTFTGADGDRAFVGGAILPGLRLQFQSLHQGTAALPEVSLDSAPPRWASNTPDAIASGILHTVLAGICDFLQDWWRQFPDSPIVLTGGDGDRLHQLLIQQRPETAALVQIDPHLVFWGIRAVRDRP